MVLIKNKIKKILAKGCCKCILPFLMFFCIAVQQGLETLCCTVSTKNKNKKQILIFFKHFRLRAIKKTIAKLDMTKLSLAF